MFRSTLCRVSGLVFFSDFAQIYCHVPVTRLEAVNVAERAWRDRVIEATESARSTLVGELDGRY